MSSEAEQLGALNVTWSSKVARASEAHAGIFVAILLIGLFAAAIIEDIRAPLWTDELLSLYVARQPTVSDVFGAIREGADSQPPLYDLIVRSLHPVIASDALRLRLPSTIGFFLMCAYVFAFVRKRLPAAYAVFAMLIAAHTTWKYAFEGRSYGMVLGCVSVALVCWQAAAETGNRRAATGLALSLAAAIAFHYVAILVLCALFAGESVRWWKTRKLDIPVLAALGFPALILIPHWPLIRAGKPFVKYFWSKASLGTLYDFYMPVAWSLALVFYLAVVCLIWLAARRFKAGKEEHRQTAGGLPAPEWVAGLTLMLLPAFAILASYLTIQVFVDRYVLWSMIGVAIFLAAALYRLAGGNRMVAAIVTLPLLIGTVRMITGTGTDRPALRGAGSLSRELRLIPPGPMPVVIAGLHAFMQLSYYAEPALRQRLAYLVSPDLERYYTQTDTGSLLLSALRRRVPLGIADYDAFIAANPAFMIAGEPGEWIVRHLHRLNYRFVPLEGGANPTIFEVQAPSGLGLAR